MEEPIKPKRRRRTTKPPVKLSLWEKIKKYKILIGIVVLVLLLIFFVFIPMTKRAVGNYLDNREIKTEERLLKKVDASIINKVDSVIVQEAGIIESIKEEDKANEERVNHEKQGYNERVERKKNLKAEYDKIDRDTSIDNIHDARRRAMSRLRQYSKE